MKAYKYAAFDYLLKPIAPEELCKTIERLKVKRQQVGLQERLSLLMKTLEEPKKLPSKITVSNSDGISVLNISEIVYLQADGPYTTFYLMNGGKIVSSHNLKEYEDILSEQGFFRSHHSFLLNLNHTVKYLKSDGYNGKHVEVSKRRKDEFVQRLTNL